MYTCRGSRANAYARKQLGWRSCEAACASRSARAAAFPSRGTTLSATSSPVCSSRASQTDPEPPLPSGRNGRYRPSMSPPPSSARAAFDMGPDRLAAEGSFPLAAPGPSKVPDHVSTYDDDEIEFDFFDEPETAEATQRGRRLPRRGRGRDGGDGPRRPQLRAPTGLVPLARLVGLIAIAIALVVALVFWVGACQGKNKHDEYASYAAKVREIAQSSQALGVEFANALPALRLKQADLEQKLQQYAQQEQQAYDQAQQIRAPGPVRPIHQHLVDALD